jgi:hypothetical protein
MLQQAIRKIALVAVFAAFAAPLAFSQGTSGLKPPPYRGVAVHVDGIFVTPVPGVPLTAVVEVQSTQTLADGSTNVKKTINNIARDFQGRIYNERRRLVSASFAATPELLSFHLYDPVTRLNTFLDPATHVARQFTHPMPNPDANLGVAGPENIPGSEKQDLGTETMEKFLVHGTRATRTVLAAASGTGKPVVVTDEYWYSDELHLNMLVKHDDPRSGQQTVTVTRVNRNEPDPSTFEIPAGYKIADETPEP